MEHPSFQFVFVDLVIRENRFLKYFRYIYTETNWTVERVRDLRGGLLEISAQCRTNYQALQAPNSTLKGSSMTFLF
jgi:hypothetical protein